MLLRTQATVFRRGSAYIAVERVAEDVVQVYVDYKGETFRFNVSRDEAIAFAQALGIVTGGHDLYSTTELREEES